jgi:solute carrier family 25 folate transporter 32
VSFFFDYPPFFSATLKHVLNAPTHLCTAPEDRSPLQSRTILLCSALSKMVASLATYPHEVLRTRLQIHRSQAGLASQAAAVAAASRGAGEVLGAVSEPVVQPPTAASSTARGLIGEFKSILRQDGWRGFYRGLSINLVRTVPNSAVTMLT